MYRIKIDEVTHKILGYEKVNEYLMGYQSDILIENISMSDIGSYYENGKIIQEEREDYHWEHSRLQKAFNEQTEKFSNENDKVIQALLHGNLEEVKAEMQEAKGKAEEILSQIKELEESHKKKVEEYYNHCNQELDELVSPQSYSSVVLLIKDENEYLEEWITNYVALGFEHIYIYDNGSKIPVKDALSLLPKEILALITVVDFSGSYEDLQTDCYNHFLNHYGKETRWVSFLDSDELLRITEEGIHSINEFLKKRERNTVIHMDFTEYGADGNLVWEKKPMRERFQIPVLINDGIYYKDIIQPARIDQMQTHYARFNPEKHPVMEKDKNLIVVDHYYTKSWEEWKKKIERGSCDPNYLKRLNEFFAYNPDMTELYNGKDAVQGYYTGETESIMDIKH